MSLDEQLRTLARAHEAPGSGDELAVLLRAVVSAGRDVQRAIAMAAFTGDFAPSGVINVQEEVQQKLDVIAHQAFASAFQACGLVHTLISEEVEEATLLCEEGRYMVALDPIDGSSNLAVNIPTGTIFSVHSAGTLHGALPKGREQLLAGYVLYGPSMVLVYAHKKIGVLVFTHHPDADDLICSHQRVRVPENGRIYSLNEGMVRDVKEGIRAYLSHCKAERMTGRYVGSLVVDFHRNLLAGGVFLYPSSQANKEGKVRLLYEASPLAFIVELAGGKATNEAGKPIMDLAPERIHQRTPLCIGSPAMVEAFLRFST